MKLLVIDGNSIVNRAFYGIKLLSTKDGQFTNGIYGFLNILLKLISDCEPTHVAVAFDVHAPTFRHKMFDEYKAGRKGMPPELRSQMPLLKEILTALGYTVVEKEGYEADDILGTLSAACKENDRCFLATGDRDSLQLVSKNTQVLLASTKMGKAVTCIYDEEALLQQYGVEPKGMIEIKALMGDSSDNIPGVAGIGQKTAGDLIAKFGSINYIYDHIDEIDIKKGVHDKLIAGKDSAYLSRTLGTICLSAPIDTQPETYEIKPKDTKTAIRLFAKLEMFGMIEKFGLTNSSEAAEQEIKAAKEELNFEFYEERDLPGLLGKIKNEGKAYFTYILNDSHLSSLIFALGNKLAYVPENCFDFAEFTQSFFAMDCEKYTHDIKLLYKYAFAEGFDLKGIVMDTTLAGYIINPALSSYDILRLCEGYEIEAPKLEINEELLNEARSAAVLAPLCTKLAQEIEANSQQQLFYEIELPLAKVLASMEFTGFKVSAKSIEEYGRELSKRIEEIKANIFAQMGFEINLNSPKQLGVALFEKMELPCKKKTKSGYSTNAEVLEELAFEYPIVKDILTYRTLSKLKSTYCDSLLKCIENDGRIRSTLNQTETRTGRISSLDPNLQNIPVRTAEGREIRKFFTCEAGNCLVDADYSQIELRVLSHIAGDEAMLTAFKNGEDIHAVTASQVFNMPLNMVTPLMRSRAKAVNFGIVYGIGPFSLAKDIGVSRKEADNYIKGYLHHYSDIDKYLKSSVETAREKGYSETVFHRRRYLPELTASNKMLQAFGERVAKNMPIQGTAADIIKLAMIKVYERLEKDFPAARLIMQVHDELIVECEEKDKEKVSALVKEEMENAVSMKVQLLSDVHSGKTWFEAK